MVAGRGFGAAVADGWRLLRWPGMDAGPGETERGRTGPVPVGARSGEGIDGDGGETDGEVIPGPVRRTTFSHFLHLKREAARP